MSYVLQRLLTFPLILFGVALVVFFSVRLIPGDAITAMLGTEAGLLTPDQRAALARYFGIDQPAWVQFINWLGGLVQGDMGISVTYGKPVFSVILSHFPLTLELALLSMIIALIVGVPLGVLAATRNERPSDLVVRILAMLGQSTPNFVLGLLIIYTLSVYFGMVPTMGAFTPIAEDPVANLGQLIFPAITLGFAFAASVMRISRSSMLDVLNEDYVRTARSKGAAPMSVIWRHALPNALIPVVTLSGVEFGYLLGGAVIVEQIFALPGLGRLVLDAITHRDYALGQGTVLFIAFNFLLVNLIVDLAYVALDPRIRVGEELMRILKDLFRHPSGRIGATIILVYLVIAILGMLGLTPHNALKAFPPDRLKPPSTTYLMGTDLLGRDTASRLMLGIGQSFVVAFASVAHNLATLRVPIIGLLAAWWGRVWDGLLMRIMDVLLAFPAILLALLIIAIVGPGPMTSITAIAIVYTPIFARVVRGPSLSLKRREFVDAARTFGSSESYILSRHLLLNLVAPLTVQVTLALAWALLTEAGLSFLGLGTQPPAPSLGLMLSESRNLMQHAPWLMFFPGLVIMFGILGFNLTGDALRDILDPRTQRREA